MFVIGIGRNLNRRELAAVASDPDSEHLFYYGFNDLSAFVDQMSTTSCNGTVAPTYSVQVSILTLKLRD